MKLALIADFGTTHVKVGIVSLSGKLLVSKKHMLNLRRSEKGALEHDPDELFDSFVNLCREAIQGYENQISVVGFSGYQFGFMPMGSDGQPLTGMITLLDTRSKYIMTKLEKELPYREIYQKTGCPPFSPYILCRLAWLKEAKPDIFYKSEWFADIKSYLLYRLCGQRYTDSGVASSSQLFNIHTLEWDDDLLDLAGIKKEQLPEVVKGEEVISTLSPASAGLLGLKSGVPVIPGVFDGGALLLGLGGYNGNMGVCNLGTTAMLRTCSNKAQIDDPDKRRLQTYALMKDRWAFGAALNNAGVSIRWFKGVMAPSYDYGTLNKIAGEITAGSDGLFCLPFLTGERDPRIGSYATGSFFGLKEYHTLGHMTRSVMEGVGYGLNLIKNVIEENGVEMEGIRLGGAGSNSAVWTQILADIFNMPVCKSLTEDAGCTGGAILAFTAIGEFKNIQEASEIMVQADKPIDPIKENVKMYQEGFVFYSELIERFRELYAIHTRYSF